MNKKMILTNKELLQVVKQIVEQVEEEYYKISPEEYLQLMSLGSYHGKAITKMKRFEGKPLWITGDLSLEGTPTDNLGNVAYVDGSLNISNTKVSNLGDMRVKSYISDRDTPREKIRERQELLGKQAEMDSKREDDEWNFQNHDEEGLKAMALLEWLEGEGRVTVLNDEQKEELSLLTQQLEELNADYDDEHRDGDPDENVEILNKIEDVEERISELTEDVADIYDMYPVSKYSHYGLTSFEVLVDGFRDEEYSVGTHDEMDKAALEYAESYVDDIGVDGFSKGFIDDYLDEDAIVEFAREDYEYQVRENPESYFNDDDYELTSEQEERIEQLESQIEDLEQQKLELDSDDENYYDYEEDLDNQIEALQEELDNIEVDTEPTEDMIDNMVESLVRDVRRDPIGYLNDYGLPVKEYVDESALAQGLVDSEGWGFMNSYDNRYDSEEVNGVTYYIMRTN
jgi:hypothetical protein